MGILKRWLAHPLTVGLDVDDPRTTAIRRSIIRQKPFLRRIYEEWYDLVVEALPAAPATGRILEIGSGAGFLSERLPALITSEVFPTPGVSIVADGHRLPLAAASLRAIVMTDVFHHLSDVGSFLREAARCLRPGGRIIMIEPWVTPWSSFVYRRLHHEPFDPGARQWAFPKSGPLSGANIALPWMVTCRDRARLDRERPELTVLQTQPILPLRYLLSGGVSLRALMPEWSFVFWKCLEDCLRPWMSTWGMFARIVIERTGKG